MTERKAYGALALAIAGIWIGAVGCDKNKETARHEPISDTADIADAPAPDIGFETFVAVSYTHLTLPTKA